MVRIVVFVAAALVVGSADVAGQAGQQQDSGVAGLYRCEGTNPDGSPYTGLVEIAAIKETYLVRWTLSDHVQVLGVGMLRDGVLAVSYFGGTPAVAVYRVQGDRLVGEWTMGGTEGMVYAETLTRMKEGERPPEPPEGQRRRPTRPRITI